MSKEECDDPAAKGGVRGRLERACHWQTDIRLSRCLLARSRGTKFIQHSRFDNPQHVGQNPEDACATARKVSTCSYHSQHAADSSSRVKEGQFYEAHQQLRVIASRYTMSSDWASAVDLLASGASMLLKAGQGASGGDLCMFLMDVYGKAELKPDTTNKARLLSLLREFPEGEPTRKRFAGEVIGYIHQPVT
jgi:hypothetical protein